jgi:hypothetical protein
MFNTLKGKLMFKIIISALAKMWNRTRKGRRKISPNSDDTLNVLIPSGMIAIAMFVAMVMGLVAVLSVIR